MGASKTSKTTRQARILRVISGIQKYFANPATLMLGGISYATTDLIKLLQADIAASNTATATRAQLTADVAAERSSHQKVDPLLHFIKSLVMGQFGDTPDSAKMLDEFGYTPRKPRTKSVKVKAAAADKAAATRVARHTLGPKAKAKVKGVVAPEPSTDGTAAQAPEAPAGNPPVPPKPTAQ